MRRLTVLLAAFALAAMGAPAQPRATPQDGVFVDTLGVLRWKGSNQEVSLFGVNYTTPFAYAYRANKRLGLSLKHAIDLDVAHMARLGFDAFRVHVWDREISDQQGNLLSNEHLDLFDYLLAKLAERNIRSIITPIAWWGNGWPEPDEHTDGFSQAYSRLELITNSQARAAGRNYLTQFIRHRNPYTNRTAIDDPALLAVEIINEPTHPEDPEATTEYINEMVSVLRSAGFEKPIFYNISQNWSAEQADAVGRSTADGVSFQWYPTDLVHGKMLEGNYLPNVSAYPVPSANVVNYTTKAKMVYEFDAADVGGSYMYPAMARSFREAGMQFAAMFSYDPVQIAWSNTEYPTHFMNLLYTPSKALSLMIAGEAFRRLPRTGSFGSYPESNRFGDFRVDFEEDLSVMNTDDAYLYSNSTEDPPKKPASLVRLAGCGSSPLVRYDGTGAYFLDKMERGVWRLEVYPDVMWVRDPFGKASLSDPSARLFWNERRIMITLPDLGEDCVLRPQESPGEDTMNGGAVRPGVYLVLAKDRKGKEREERAKAEPFLEGLFAPPASRWGVYVANETPSSAAEASDPGFRFVIAHERPITSTSLYLRRPTWRGFSKYALTNTGGFQYGVADSLPALRSGPVEYCLAVEVGETTYTFPGGTHEVPGRWDFSARDLWTLTIVKPDDPLVLLDAARDMRDFVFPHFTRSMRYAVEVQNGVDPQDRSLAVRVAFSESARRPFGVHLAVARRIRQYPDQLRSGRSVVVAARSDSLSVVRIVLVMSDGSCFGANLTIGDLWKEHEIPLSSFQSADALLLPSAYPLFLPLEWKGAGHDTGSVPDLRKLEAIQVLTDPADAKVLPGAREANFQIATILLTR